MTPYYDQDGITIYHGDCLDILPSLPKVDAVVTDPPFWLLARTFDAADNAVSLSRIWPVAIEMRSLIVPGGLAAIFYDSRALPLALDAFRYAQWTYVRHLTFYRRWGNAHQFQGWMSTSDFLLLFSEGSQKPEFYGPWKHDVYIRDSKEAVDTGHPNQKPLDSVTHLVGNITPPNGIVLDPFMGSGTTLQAAQETERRAIGIEIEERYCEIAVQRLAQGVLALEGTNR